MSETAMSAALKHAGYDTSSRVFSVAQECIRSANGARAKAARLLWDRLRTDEELRDAAMGLFISIVAEDMRGAGQNATAENGHSSGAPSPHTHSREAGQWNLASSGQFIDAPSREPELADGVGHRSAADEANRVAPPARESLTEAARTLRKAPGSGALQPRAYEKRMEVRGESWLLSAAIPGGPRLLSLTWGEAHSMVRRMANEGGERMAAAAALAALLKEGDLLGRVSPDQVIEKTLSPAAIDRVARLVDPEKLRALGRKATREFAKNHVEMIGAANG